MIDNIVGGISHELSKIFDDRYEIFLEDIDPGFNEPCFLITGLNNQKIELGRMRFIHGRSFMIQFFPENNLNKHSQCTIVGDILLNELECIPFQNGKIRCTNMQYEIENNILKFSMNCNTIVTKLENKEKMKEIEIRQGAK